MSANNDSAMSRFLFAILKQKNLKDINWEAVAKDEVLDKPITNGHAARMRFSRFRNAIQGNEPAKRNRTGQPKNRVTKSKKDPKEKKDVRVKLEGALQFLPDSSATPEPSETPAPEIKQERVPYDFGDRFTPRLTPGPSSAMLAASVLQRNHGVIQPRFLTPCSDTDFFSPSPALASSPTGDMMASPASFSFRDSPCPERPDPMWSSVPHYSAYGSGASFDEFRSSPCEGPYAHSHSQAPQGHPYRTIEVEEDYVVVKAEREECP
ncbi:hypothetical protein F4811DRAFT_491638 [Daldinia bambusicola]|nr:hypothetical protein F4811DRAFT_491638 [Daldinia bambusicola]